MKNIKKKIEKRRLRLLKHRHNFIVKDKSKYICKYKPIKEMNDKCEYWDDFFVFGCTGCASLKRKE
jgi:hypothetical protein